MARFKWDRPGEGPGITGSLTEPVRGEVPLPPLPRPYQLWTGQMWLLESAMAYLGERQQGLLQPPASLHPCSWPSPGASPRDQPWEWGDTSPTCLPGASAHPLAPPSFTKQRKEKQVHEPSPRSRELPLTGTKSPCPVPPSLLRATSCSSSVQLWLLLWALFPVALLYSPGSGGLLYREPPTLAWGSPPAHSSAGRHLMATGL